MASFLLTFLLYVLAGLVGSLGIRLLYDKGPSANKLHVTLVITAVSCLFVVWAIVYLAQWHPLVEPILKAEGE